MNIWIQSAIISLILFLCIVNIRKLIILLVNGTCIIMLGVILVLSYLIMALHNTLNYLGGKK